MSDDREPPYHGWVPNEFLDSLELSVRADRVLRCRGGVDSWEAFMALTRADVLKLRSAGAKTWREIADLQDYWRNRSEELVPVVEWSQDQRLTVLRTVVASIDPNTGSIDGDTDVWVSIANHLLRKFK